MCSCRYKYTAVKHPTNEQGRIQKVWLGGRMEAPGAEAPRSSTEGASRVERRRREVGEVWGGGVLLESFTILSSKRRVLVHSGTDKTYF